MAKSANQKLKLLYLCRYLLTSSNDSHPVTVADMIAYLSRQGIAAERKSIYDDLEALRVFGLDVQSVRDGSAMGYFIGERDFQLPELKLLVDSVQSSKFITSKKSMELIGKLERLTDEYDARQLGRQVYVRGRIKTMNESIYYNVDAIHAAIDGDRAITFRYFDWSVEKKRVWRHDGRRYQASPWALMWDDDNYYLVAFDHPEGMFKHFRVDKMGGITPMVEARRGAGEFACLDMAAYTDTHFGMFSGPVRPVRLSFENALAGAVIDRFGMGVSLIPLDEGHFSVTVNAAVNVQFFGWLCGFGDRAKILGPDDVTEGMCRHLAAMTALYGPVSEG